MAKLLFFLLLLSGLSVEAQLKAGFDKEEYIDLLKIFSRIDDTSHYKPSLPYPSGYKLIYTSKETGLKNLWQLWYRASSSVAVICIRGTIASNVSWLENFYAAMVPAHGRLIVNDSNLFSYTLAADSQAMVHAGWLTGMASMAPDIVNKIREAAKNGIHDFLIMGHSQGGGIAYLLTSYLFYLKKDGQLPGDITFKTYCSAAPKPGNLVYAYDYDYITRNGWAFTIVNAADWVPQTPVSIQTLHDFSTPNPFTDIKAALRKQPFFIRWFLISRYNRLKNSALRAQKLYTNYLGRKAFRLVRKSLPKLQQPAYTNSDNYQRAGTQIVLQPDESYWKIYPRNSTNPFLHHFLDPYYRLVQVY